MFASAYPFLEELWLVNTDEGLEFLALKFTDFKALSLLSCVGFGVDDPASIATH